MAYYETVFIARQELSQKQVDDLTQHFCKFITDVKGKIHKTEYWGLRTLAYKINKSRKGHYVLIESDTAPEGLLEMERNMRLHEDVMRYMSLREENLSTGPSIMMEKGGKDIEPDEKEAA